MKVPTFTILAACTLVVLGCPPPAARLPDRPATSSSISPQAQAEFDAAFDLYAQGRYAQAQEAFDRLIARHPDEPIIGEARYRRGVALNRLERFEDSRGVLREFLEKHPTSPYARQGTVELGLAEAKLGNIQDAEQILRPVVPELSSEERQEVGFALDEVIKAGSGTLESMHRASLDADAGVSGALAELARLMDEQASFEDIARLAESLKPSSVAAPLVSAKLARIYYHLGDHDRARAQAERALQAGQGPWREPAEKVLERLRIRSQVSPRKVGVIVPMTGRFKAFGDAIIDGIKYAITGRDGIELLYRDSQGDPQQAVSLVEELAQQGVVAIIGPVGVNEALPAALRAEELGVPMISLSRAEGVTGIGSWIFRNSLTNSAQGKALARYALEELKVQKAAIFAPDIESGEEVTGAFWRALEEGGGEVRGHELYAHDQTTFSAPIKRLVARDSLENREGYAAQRSQIYATEKDPYRRRRALEKLASEQAPIIDFDVLLLPDYWRSATLIAPALAVEDIITNGCDERDLERIKKTTKRKDIRPVTMLGTAGWNNPNLVARGGRFVACSVFVDGFYAGSSREQTRRFVEDFQLEYARKPGLLEAQGYDTARIVRQIILDSRPSTREAFRSALASVKAFPGVTGDTTFTADREADKPLFFLSVDRTGTIIELTDVRISPGGVAVKPKVVEK